MPLTQTRNESEGSGKLTVLFDLSATKWAFSVADGCLQLRQAIEGFTRPHAISGHLRRLEGHRRMCSSLNSPASRWASSRYTQSSSCGPLLPWNSDQKHHACGVMPKIEGEPLADEAGTGKFLDE